MQIRFPGFQYIVAEPAFCDGKPRIQGTRITVAAILSYTAGGMSAQAIVLEFPQLKLEAVYEALAFAAASFQDRYIPLQLSPAKAA